MSFLTKYCIAGIDVTYKYEKICTHIFSSTCYIFSPHLIFNHLRIVFTADMKKGIDRLCFFLRTHIRIDIENFITATSFVPVLLLLLCSPRICFLAVATASRI